MKKIYFSTMIACLLAFVGCQNEELVNETTDTGNGKKVTLTANIAGATDSRVAFNEISSDGELNVGALVINVNWRDDSDNPEKFKVHGTGSEPVWNEFTQTSESNKFEGTLPDGADYAYYGYTISSGALSYDLSEQDGTLNEDYILMQAPVNENSNNITFHHKTAILKIKFETSDGTSVDTAISEIVMDNVHAQSGSDYSSITITPAQASLGYFYIFLPIQDENSYANHIFIFSVTAVSSDTAVSKDYTATLTIPNGMSIEAGNLYTADIALTEVNYVWTSGIAASEPVVGNGNENSPYLIHSANNLQWMIEQVNNDGNSTPQIPYYRLIHNLEIDSEEDAPWTPIGTEDSPFVGYFDGCGWTISGEMHTTTDLVGFFGYNAGSISNLKNTAEVKDCRTESPMNNEYSAIGSIAGYSTGKIINCENSGSVTAADITTTTYTGGICGYQYRDNCETIALITECKNSGNVTGDDDDDDATGGIVGCAVGIRVGQPYYSPIISACENAGSVTTGDNTPIISPCENAGSVTTGDNIGGICGLAKGSTAIVACLNIGNAGVGGILGDGEIYDLYGCCTTQGYIRSKEVDSGFIYACYTFDVNYKNEDEYVDYSEREWVEEIVGPCNDEDHINMELTEMNYGIVCANAFYEYPCNWHWKVGEVGENYIPNLVEGAPLGSAGG